MFFIIFSLISFELAGIMSNAILYLKISLFYILIAIGYFFY
jgi:hypothetical protein